MKASMHGINLLLLEEFGELGVRIQMWPCREWGC